jgi:peptidoglycan/LPS O-acetylase OafA/YrhL
VVTSGSAVRPVAALAASTPATRDRFLDLVRAASIIVVVLGHYTIAAVEHGHGGLVGTNALSSTVGLRVATWLSR